MTRIKRLIGILLPAALLLVIAVPRASAWFTSPLKIYPVQRQVLPNGMTVILQEVHARPLVSVNIFVRAGGYLDTPRLDGMAHFYEHLFFRGTPTRSGMEMKRQIEELGGQTNAETTKDFTHFYVDLPSGHVLDAIEILGDALMHPAFAPKDIDQERLVVLNEVGMNDQSPSSLLMRLMYDSAYKVHPYRNSVIGNERAIKNVTRNDFLDFQHKYYTPDRVVLVVVGDFHVAPVMRHIERFFKDFQGGSPTPDASQPEPVQSEVRNVLEEMNIGNSFVLLGYHVAGFKQTADVVALDVLTFMLGQGEGSILNRDLVYQNRLAWGVNVDFLTQRDPGLMIISANAPANKTDDARTALLRDIQMIREGRFSNQDLERARNYLAHVYLLGNETNRGKASELGNYAVLGSVDFAINYLDRVNQVTRDDIIRVARTYLGDNYTQVMLRPPERQER